MNIEWNSVTWYSKLIAVVLFVLVFFGGFKFGIEYQKIKAGSKTSVPQSSIGQLTLKKDFVLRVGEYGQINDLKFKVASIVGDSRCPKDVNCIWAGNVEVKVIFEKSEQSEELTIKSDDGANFFGDYAITLTGIKPAKNSQDKIDEGDYVFNFHVEKVK